MSLTSYRAAPPRAELVVHRVVCGGVVNGFLRARFAPATKPGGVLLFHRLGDSTIGAVWFHGRVRDGIGWVTDAMATKLCGRRAEDGHGLEIDIVHTMLRKSSATHGGANQPCR